MNKKKSIIFSFIIFIVFCMILEFFSIFVIYLIKDKEIVQQFEFYAKHKKGYGINNILSWKNHLLVPFVQENNIYNKEGLLFNNYGYRSKHMPGKNTIKIACIGGSTTLGWTAKTENTWPYYLEQLLCFYLKKEIDVMNFGIPAASSELNLALLNTRILAMKPDIILILEGLNDVRVWAIDKKRKSDLSDYNIKCNWPQKKNINLSLTFARYSRFYRLLLYFKAYITDKNIGQYFCWYSGIIKNKNNDSIYKEIKWQDMFYRNLTNMVGICKAHEIDLYLLTNIQLNLDKNEALETNKIIKKVAKKQEIPLINIKFLDKNYYIDEIHLNANGHKMKAQQIFDVLKKNIIFIDIIKSGKILGMTSEQIIASLGKPDNIITKTINKDSKSFKEQWIYRGLYSILFDVKKTKKIVIQMNEINSNFIDYNEGRKNL